MKKLVPLLLFVPFFVSIAMLSTSCGDNDGECAATNTGLVDEDSDCVPNSSDNCPQTYNPSQFDNDEDGIGAACDADDDDDTVAGVLANSDDLEDEDDWQAEDDQANEVSE